MGLTKVTYAMIEGAPINVLDYGAVGDGVTDDTAAIQAAIDAASVNGGIIDGSSLTYCLNTGGVVIDADNVLIVNATFKRTTTTTGWLLKWANGANTTGGGLINVDLIGITTVSGGNAGVLFGSSSSYKANSFVCENVTASSFSQYGVGIGNGDNWNVSNVRVLEHGLTSGTIAGCIGFYVYPDVASSGGQINNVYSQISDACVANTSANTAAIKLQTHQNLTATNLTSIYGREESFVIDSVQGIISNIYVKQQPGRAGLAVGNYNPAHSFSGQKFTLDGFVVESSGSTPNNEFVLSGTNGQYNLNGCVIRNGKAGGGGYLNYGNAANCVFENLSFGDLRFSTDARGYLTNSLASTNNIYRNVTVDGSVLNGTFAVETTDSTLIDCGGIAADGYTVSTMAIYGSNNQIVNPTINNGSSNALEVNGDSNYIYNLNIKNVANKAVYFPVGSDNNIVYSGNLYDSTGVTNSGSGNLFYGRTKTFDGSAAPTTGTWAVGDKVYEIVPTSGGYIGWVCTTAGTPGTWKTFGAIS